VPLLLILRGGRNIIKYNLLLEPTTCIDIKFCSSHKLSTPIHVLIYIKICQDVNARLRRLMLTNYATRRMGFVRTKKLIQNFLIIFFRNC